MRKAIGVVLKKSKKSDDHDTSSATTSDGMAPSTLRSTFCGQWRSALVVLLLGDPHLLEGGQRGQDGATDPDGVLPLRGSDDLGKSTVLTAGLLAMTENLVP
jgi:hypothetical protein